ncbi:hypothetical protein DOTSEDRAFT_74913 [Dothistroma septosporum NZE10]|uniref:VanZ-like domain-containing protein n=1 Tax=Dothistroma septosporum (strain NZE10 / CBS 128990) TaxID=675120 RepID=N1PDU0_DOTSN|nr:hypothetical protein DOTSEDRAFT_74913 [Dothistroma septosporum NZE10]
MSSLRIRQPFAASFAVLLLVSAYLGLSTQKLPQYGQSDKGLHFITFFLLTTSFYWTLDLPRRRIIHATLLVVTAGLAIGSEIVQALLPNGRDFDPFDILANVLGSTASLILCSVYHKRMLERRRKNKNYDIVPGDELADEENGGELDDLGRAEAGLGAQETGTVAVDPPQAEGGAAVPAPAKNVDVGEELDNWDENEEDWEQGVDGLGEEEGVGGAKKRVD